MPFATVKSDPYRKRSRPTRRCTDHLWPEEVWRRIVDCFVPAPAKIDLPHLSLLDTNIFVMVKDWTIVVREANNLERKSFKNTDTHQ